MHLAFSVTDNVIGGSAAGARNLISENTQNGVLIATGAANNRVEGNYIGTDVNGTAALANNGVGGIYILNGNNNTIGGTNNSARNLISGNTGGGIG